MVILEKYSNFKNEIREVKGLGKAVFSIDDNSRIWHEIASKQEVDDNKVFIMISDYNIVQIEKDPTLISPIENSTIVSINSTDFNVGNFVHIREDELIKLSKPDTNLIEHRLNEETLIWEEGASQEEIEASFKNTVNEIKAQVLLDGFKFIKDGITHQQKNRNTDRTLLSSSMSSMERQGKNSIYWSFNDDDVVELSLEELQRIEDEGFIITQAIFAVEAQLKAGDSISNLTLDMYKDMVDNMSEIKCWR